MESTYAYMNNDGETISYIEELEELAKDNINFSNTSFLGGAYQIENLGWTIAGMVAQTSGIPLNILVDGNSYTGYSSFLSGAYSIGDVLKANGYNNYLMIGSDATFGGRKDFFKLHGNYEIFDYYTAIDKKYIDDDYYEWWGIEDEKLYEYAKEELLTYLKRMNHLILLC